MVFRSETDVHHKTRDRVCKAAVLFLYETDTNMTGQVVFFLYYLLACMSDFDNRPGQSPPFSGPLSSSCRAHPVFDARPGFRLRDDRSEQTELHCMLQVHIKGQLPPAGSVTKSHSATYLFEACRFSDWSLIAGPASDLLRVEASTDTVGANADVSQTA